jgi:LysR family transcriptional regulator, regulator for bpeEF and oprC
MFDLNAVADFIAIVRAGSFAAAARATSTPKSTLSKRLLTLEAALDARLIARNTRSLRLTAEGAAFHEHALRIVAEAEAAQSFLAARHAAPQGVLRISAPVLFGQVFLGGIAADYVRHNPLARIEVVLADRRVDLLEENIEAAIRIGEQPDSTLVLRTFAEVDQVLVAAPGGPMPQTPEDIAALPCIAHAVDAQARSTWRLVRGLRSVRIEVAPVITVTSMVAVREAALAGAGLAYLPRFLVAGDLASGRLVQPLPDWAGPRVPIAVVYPSARFASPRLRAFVDLLVERFPDRQLV